MRHYARGPCLRGSLTASKLRLAPRFCTDRHFMFSSLEALSDETLTLLGIWVYVGYRAHSYYRRHPGPIAPTA